MEVRLAQFDFLHGVVREVPWTATPTGMKDIFIFRAQQLQLLAIDGVLQVNL